MKEDKKIPNEQDFRERIKREDDLLNTRTSLFLVTNGLFLAAVGLSFDPLIQLIIITLGLIITITWLISSWQNWKVIKHLTIAYRKDHHSNYIEEIVQNALFRSGWKRPTDLLAKPLPLAFMITWLVLLTISIIQIIK